MRVTNGIPLGSALLLPLPPYIASKHLRHNSNDCSDKSGFNLALAYRQGPGGANNGYEKTFMLPSAAFLKLCVRTVC
jgi:hypothetical protein